MWDFVSPFFFNEILKWIVCMCAISIMSRPNINQCVFVNLNMIHMPYSTQSLYPDKGSIHGVYFYTSKGWKFRASGVSMRDLKQ